MFSNLDSSPGDCFDSHSLSMGGFTRSKCNSISFMCDSVLTNISFSCVNYTHGRIQLMSERISQIAQALDRHENLKFYVYSYIPFSTIGFFCVRSEVWLLYRHLCLLSSCLLLVLFPFSLKACSVFQILCTRLL